MSSIIKVERAWVNLPVGLADGMITTVITDTECDLSSQAAGETRFIFIVQLSPVGTN